MELSNELLAKAKAAKSPEELLTLAKENHVEMTEESAKAYFDQLHPQTGELSDDELDNVAGGGCYARGGKMVVSALHKCNNFYCKYCGGRGLHGGCCARCDVIAYCGDCQYCTYEKGLWLCNNPIYRR